jgi:hypothetical protein
MTQVMQKPPPKTQKVSTNETNDTNFTILSKEEALKLTSEVIEKYRPALEELANFGLGLADGSCDEEYAKEWIKSHIETSSSL